MQFRLLVPLIALGLFALSGCNRADPELQRFGSCAEVEDYYKEVALQALDHEGQWLRGWWWQWGDCWDCNVRGGRGLGVDMALEDAAPQAGGGDGGASSFSTTNTQEVGVDEADFVKNDDEFIYVLSGAELVIVDAWPAEEMSQVSATTIEGMPTDMFLNEDQLIVFSSIYERPEPASGLDVDLDLEWGLSKVTLLDVSDRSAPVVEREVYIDGWLSNSRRIGDKVYLVVYHPNRGPSVAAIEGAGNWESAQREAVNESGIDDWISFKTELRQQDGEWSKTTAHAVDCTNIYRPGKAHGMGLVSVQALDLTDATTDLQGSAILSNLSLVYASTDSLFVTENRWKNGNWWANGGQMWTHVHRFDVSENPDEPTYRSSGEIPGWLLNSFALSEHDGFLRVATTEGRWGRNTTNSVYILEETGSIMDTVGSVEGLAPGETIFAVRFLGEKGYIVTFERIDPLFTMDLSDPRNPRVLGELHITGFSNYLHPLGDGHLIGIGEEIHPRTMENLGMQISLFDVSDMGDPSLVDRDVLDIGWGWSEAQFDHHAFNYFEENECLAVPVVVYENWAERVFTGLQVYRVTPAGGIEELGQLDQGSLALAEDELNPWNDAYCSQVRRSIFMEDRLYAVSAGGIVVASIDDLSTPLSEVPFADWGGCYDGWF
jgi:hypothetical protein